MILGVIYIFLGFLTRKYSLISFLISIMIYIGSIIANFILHGFDFVATDIFVHVIVCVFLSWGVWSSLELQQLNNKLYGKS